MSLPNYETLLTEMVEPHLLKITLNRPQVGNALNTQMGHDFLDLWTRLTEDTQDIRGCHAAWVDQSSRIPCP